MCLHRLPRSFGSEFGYYTDPETGLLCLTHRYYDPGAGKFLNRDPIGYAGGLNLYGFAGNNPVNESDPSGFDPLLSGQDLKEGLGTGWAGFSTAVWNTWGLSNLNRKYSLYSPGDYANQPGYNVSVGLATTGIALLPIPGGAKLNAFIRATRAVQAIEASGGAARAAMWAANWSKASLVEAVAQHAGPNATSWLTATGKEIFENPATGRQVVVDLKGGYFRIFQPKTIGSIKGVYLDMMGKVPAPARYLKSGAIKNVPLTGDELKAATHFLIK